ncbi:hypothetical protein B0H13DRAFT_1872765 [Mycena leptocephala]|nr:hypothetical protein B0H13DRAFT_1872765 [Mycena leptocephala]
MFDPGEARNRIFCELKHGLRSSPGPVRLPAIANSSIPTLPKSSCTGGFFRRLACLLGSLLTHAKFGKTARTVSGHTNATQLQTADLTCIFPAARWGFDGRSGAAWRPRSALGATNLWGLSFGQIKGMLSFVKLGIFSPFVPSFIAKKPEVHPPQFDGKHAAHPAICNHSAHKHTDNPVHPLLRPDAPKLVLVDSPRHLLQWWRNITKSGGICYCLVRSQQAAGALSQQLVGGLARYSTYDRANLVGSSTIIKNVHRCVQSWTGRPHVGQDFWLNPVGPDHQAGYAGVRAEFSPPR